MVLPLVPVFAVAVIAALGGLRTHRERRAVDITRPLPARPPAGGREYRNRRR